MASTEPTEPKIPVTPEGLPGSQRRKDLTTLEEVAISEILDTKTDKERQRASNILKSKDGKERYDKIKAYMEATGTTIENKENKEISALFGQLDTALEQEEKKFKAALEESDKKFATLSIIEQVALPHIVNKFPEYLHKVVQAFLLTNGDKTLQKYLEAEGASNMSPLLQMYKDTVRFYNLALKENYDRDRGVLQKYIAVNETAYKFESSPESNPENWSHEQFVEYLYDIDNYNELRNKKTLDKTELHRLEVWTEFFNIEASQEVTDGVYTMVSDLNTIRAKRLQAKDRRAEEKAVAEQERAQEAKAQQPQIPPENLRPNRFSPLPVDVSNPFDGAGVHVEIDDRNYVVTRMPVGPEHAQIPSHVIARLEDIENGGPDNYTHCANMIVIHNRKKNTFRKNDPVPARGTAKASPHVNALVNFKDPNVTKPQPFQMNSSLEFLGVTRDDLTNGNAAMHNRDAAGRFSVAVDGVVSIIQPTELWTSSKDNILVGDYIGIPRSGRVSVFGIRGDRIQSLQVTNMRGKQIKDYHVIGQVVAPPEKDRPMLRVKLMPTTLSYTYAENAKKPSSGGDPDKAKADFVDTIIRNNPGENFLREVIQMRAEAAGDKDAMAEANDQITDAEIFKKQDAQASTAMDVDAPVHGDDNKKQPKKRRKKNADVTVAAR